MLGSGYPQWEGNKPQRAVGKKFPSACLSAGTVMMCVVFCSSVLQRLVEDIEYVDLCHKAAG